MSKKYYSLNTFKNKNVKLNVINFKLRFNLWNLDLTMVNL